VAKGYTAESIKVLEGLEAVRMRPGMYIGSTGSRGLHHMLWEIVDNGIDEVMGGYADRVTVTINSDSSVTVTDNGRGVPVDKHPQLKISGVEVVYTRLHAGGKFGDNNYAYSGGLHGVGASVVNALSEWFSVTVHQGGKKYRQEFSSTPDSRGKIVPGKPRGPLEELGKTFERGTHVTFLPDKRVFDHLRWNRGTIEQHLMDLAFLNKGLTIVFTDNRFDEPFEATYKYDGGIADFVKYLDRDRTVLHEQPIVLSGNSGGIVVEAALQYTDTYTENIFSFVNNIPTTEGGTHETGFKSALTKVMNEYARKAGILKEKDAPLSGDDFREGLTAVLSLRMKNVQFEGQTKTKLGNTEARTAVETVIAETFAMWLAELKNADITTAIMDKAVKAARVREATRKAKDLARRKHSLEAAPLVGKLAACTGKKAEENELFIVEGDSAGGSAKQGRDRRFQAILPLRGKPLNVERKRLDAVLENEEFRSIISALGCGIGEDINTAALKYNKVIILSDADQDGAHIRSILLTFFFRYMRPLITEGHVYIGQPPLYGVKSAGKITYAYDDEALAKLLVNKPRGATVQRYKGLGEMNPDQLWDTTLNPDGRKLVQVTMEDVALADRRITVLMGDKVESRREYISNNVDFNTKDSFEKMEEGR